MFTQSSGECQRAVSGTPLRAPSRAWDYLELDRSHSMLANGGMGPTKKKHLWRRGCSSRWA